MSTPEPVPDNKLAHHGNALPVGHRLHEFEITGLIGEGGFGIVYLARDTQLERTVAIKEYMPHSLAARSDDLRVSVRSERHRETFNLGMRSFVNEAKLLASFDHPALIKVYRFWEENGTAYMVMPFYQGPTLKSWLREQKGAPTEAWLKGVLAPLLDALEVIHADHCYHRDIAPDNILLLGPNKPLLLDFGAARRVIGDATQALTVILKPGYAPVEQYAEVPSMKQGPWTDVYALSAVLYAVITGKAPPPSVGRMMKDDLVPAVVAAAGRYSEPFLAAIDAGLTVHPDHRPHDVAALRALLFATSLPAGYQRPGAAPGPVDEERTVLMPPGAAPTGGTAFAPTEIATQLATQMATQVAPRTPADAAASGTMATATPGTVFGTGVGEDTASPRVERLRPTAPASTAPTGNAPAAAQTSRRTGVLAAAGVLALLGTGAGVMAWRSSHTAPDAATVIAQPASAAASVAAAARAASAEVPATVASAATLPSTTPVKEPFSIVAALEGIVRGADPLLAVNTITDKSQIVIGKDKLLFQVKSSEPGYLYVYLAGTDQSHFYLLFPNALDRNNRIEANKLIELPRKGWHITAGGPPGVDHIVTVVSPVQRDLTHLGLTSQDSIPEFDMAQAKAMWEGHAGPGSPFVGAALCDKAPCDSRYGASLVHVEEINR